MEYRYDQMEQLQKQVEAYHRDLETLLVWLLECGALDPMDGKNGFFKLGKDSWEWRQGDFSIELTEEEAEAFQRLGLF